MKKPICNSSKCERSARIFTSLLFLLVLSYLVYAPGLRAIDVVKPPEPAEPAAPVEDPAKPLGELVGKLSALDTLAPRDLADFATETIAYSQAVQAAKQPVSEKPIRDALAAVAQGRELDSKAADWDDLQARLEKFLEKPEQQDQQQQDENQQDKQQQDQQQQSGDKNDQQQNQQDGQNQDQQQQQDGQSGQNDKQQQSQQNQSGENKDQQQQQDGQSQETGDQQQSRQDKQNDGKGDSTREQEAKPQQQSAFGDMRKNEDEKKDAASQQSQEQQQPQPQPADMQQVGGADGKQQQQPVDSSMIMPLRQLDQVRDKDSPAILFQRMQAAQSGTNQIPAGGQKPKGKDW